MSFSSYNFILLLTEKYKTILFPRKKNIFFSKRDYIKFINCKLKQIILQEYMFNYPKLNYKES